MQHTVRAESPVIRQARTAYNYGYIHLIRYEIFALRFLNRVPVLKNYDLSSLVVLVAEQNSFLRLTIKSILRTLKVGQVIDAGPINEAWSAFQNTSPDVVIIDWSPSYDGLQLLWRLRHDAESRNVFVPVIITTSMTEYTNVVVARDTGTTDFLAKPYSPKTIYQHLCKIIETKKKFVKTQDFFGPDRRARMVAPEHKKRKCDA